MIPLLLGLGYLLVHAGMGFALRGQPTALAIFGNAGLLLPPIAVCAVILYRRREWEGCQRLFWDTFAVAIALWALGHAGWAYDSVVLERPLPWLGWHTVFSLCGGVGPMIALLARPHRGVRAEATGLVSFVIGSYGLLSVFVYSYFVLVPSLVHSEGHAYTALLLFVQANRTLLFVALLWAAWRARRTPWRITFGYLALGAGLGFFLRMFTSLAIARGDYYPGSVYDFAWMAPFLCYAIAAWIAPASPRGAEVFEAPSRVSVAVSAFPVLLIPVVGYGWIFANPIGAPGDSFRALLTGLMTVAGLGLFTLRLASQGSELKRADDRLRLLAAATEQTADMILITRADGVIEHANDAFVRAVGYSRRELTGRQFSEFVAEESHERGERRVSDAVAGGGIWRGTLVRRRRDGSTFPAACTVVGLRNPLGRITHFVGVERDMTDELKFRDKLVHTERLSAIGELVAGVAHEINNPLQTIIGSVELMLEDVTCDASRQDLEVVRREATRAGQIVRNLLSFVRRSAPDRMPADLNEIARATIALREFHLQQFNIALEAELHGGELPVLVNREEIQQIVLNLLLNAEHAILSASSAGTIRIRTFQAQGRHALEVSDDGPGVSAELRGRIFEPFFTTKGVGEGTGLGLSISHGIALAHGGALELCSRGPGACFRLVLPARAAAAVEAPAGTVRDGRQVALVVDDEPPIRRLLARLLERRGYQVLQAESGEAALALARREAVTMVLCDVRMPGMSGPDLYRALAPLDKERSFVFITGDRSGVSDADADLAGIPVLTKPFTAADLDGVLNP